jgi:hypothetical protein
MNRSEGVPASTPPRRRSRRNRRLGRPPRTTRLHDRRDHRSERRQRHPLTGDSARARQTDPTCGADATLVQMAPSSSPAASGTHGQANIGPTPMDNMSRLVSSAIGGTLRRCSMSTLRPRPVIRRRIGSAAGWLRVAVRAGCPRMWRHSRLGSLRATYPGSSTRSGARRGRWPRAGTRVQDER